jgi:tetratricopeptide (TPR) repeat protein
MGSPAPEGCNIIWAWGGGTNDEDITNYKRLIGIAEEMGYYRDLAILYANLELWQSFGGHYSDEYGQKAIALAEGIGDLPTLAWINIILGGVRLWGRSGKHWTEQSIPYFMRAAQVSNQIGYIQNEAMSWPRLGQSYRELGHDEKAIECFEKTLEISMKTKSIMPLILASEVMEIYGEQKREDMVVFTFYRIMQSLAALDIDEESQANALLLNTDNMISMVYSSFQKAYLLLDKALEFPGIALKTLRDLAKDVNSRPQKTWYYSQLMDICWELKDMESARNCAKNAIAIIEEMDCLNSIMTFYPVYLVLGDINMANKLVSNILTRYPGIHRITSIELAYRKFEYFDAFVNFCEKFWQQHGSIFQKHGINQICLRALDSSGGFLGMDFDDNSVSESLLPCWEWLDPEGESFYSIRHGSDQIEICAICDSSLGYGSYSSPRLYQLVTGNFIIKTQMSCAKFGGLFVQSDNDIVTFERWAWRNNPIFLTHKKYIVGRGYLDSELLILALERNGNIINTYCSPNNEDWYSCGWIETDMKDPVQVGIFASCPGNMKKATTSFDYAKIYRE